MLSMGKAPLEAIGGLQRWIVEQTMGDQWHGNILASSVATWRISQERQRPRVDATSKLPIASPVFVAI